ncbi:hypothetical protein H920_11210 [Fukomys damarensis]|uniref:Uncharacterized protein n=1 Tax=Fukomys damarensis TaxID=885580 RepID=A0A091D5M2_FUKDA|nr:hypothetical protein H920_11210 [Fukomys damarensis]
MEDSSRPPSYPCLPLNCGVRRQRPFLRDSRETEKGPGQASSQTPAAGSENPSPESPASSHPSPNSGANLWLRRQQLRCPRQTQKRRLQTASQKPPARTASGLQARGGGERQSPRYHGDAPLAGEGRPDDNDHIEAPLGLAPLC